MSDVIEPSSGCGFGREGVDRLEISVYIVETPHAPRPIPPGGCSRRADSAQERRSQARKRRPVPQQYQANTGNARFRSMAMKDRIARIPTNAAAADATITGPGENPATLCPRSGSWRNPAPAIAGMDMRNENAAASMGATPQPECGDDGGSRARDAGNESEGLCEADNQGRPSPQPGRGGPSQSPTGREQKGARDQEGKAHHLWAVEDRGHSVTEEDAQGSYRDGCDQDESNVAEVVPPSLQRNSHRQAQNAFTVNHHDRKEGREVQGDLEPDSRYLEAYERLSDDQVTGRRYGEEFGGSLYHTEAQCLPQAHAGRLSPKQLCSGPTPPRTHGRCLARKEWTRAGTHIHGLGGRVKGWALRYHGSSMYQGGPDEELGPGGEW